MSTLYLNKAYDQIALSEDSKPITAGIIPGEGLCQISCTTFGLPPATFQRLMNEVMSLYKRPHVLEYLNYVLIISKTFEEHLYWLKRTIGHLNEAGLTLSPDKCKFGQTKVKFQGFKVNKDRLSVDDDKIRPIFDCTRSRNVNHDFNLPFCVRSDWCKWLWFGGGH